MPYIYTIDNRYVHEHTCGRYHYGDETVVRDCCVEDALGLCALAEEKALTSSHPAAAAYRVAYGACTDAECEMLPDPRRLYRWLDSANGTSDYTPLTRTT